MSSCSRGRSSRGHQTRARPGQTLQQNQTWEGRVNLRKVWTKPREKRVQERVGYGHQGGMEDTQEARSREDWQYQLEDLNARKHCCNGYPKGCAAPGQVPCQCNTWEHLSKLKMTSPQRKIDVTSKSPVGDISVVTLIRTGCGIISSFLVLFIVF